MLMPWSRSACSASIRKAHSKGIPRRADICRIASNLPSGSEPVSCMRRPTIVDLPWSTWPTTTILTLGRGTPVAAVISEISVRTQPLETVLRLMVHRSSRPLGDLGALELGDDLVERIGAAGDGEGDVLIAERAIAFAVFGEIERYDGDALAADVAPDVEFRPMQQRMHADMRAGREIIVVLVPEFGRLIADVPLAALAARAEDALLGAGAFLVAADPGDQAVIAMRLDQALQPGGLARGGPRRRGQGRVDRLDRRAGADDEIELPFDLVAVAERIHLRHLLLGVDIDDRERDMAEERLLGQPHQHIRILAKRPQHAKPIDAVERLAQDVDAFAFDGVEMVHVMRSGRQVPGTPSA